MDIKIKNRLKIIALIAILGQAAFLAYMFEIYPIFPWQLIVGSSLLVIGFLMVISFFAMKNTTFKNKSHLFYAIIFNPGLVSFFAGISGITMKNPGLRLINMISFLAMLLCLIVGFIVLKIALKKQK